MALPPQVFVKRIAKRVFGVSSGAKKIETQNNPELTRIPTNSKIAPSNEAEYVKEKYLRFQADFMGTGWVDFKSQWQKDFKSGFSWNVEWPSSQQLALGIDVKGADVKVPWEFGRMHQLLRVAFYSDENMDSYFASVLEDFKKYNPIGFGVQWMNAMEVSIRAINLAAAFNQTGYNKKEDLVFLQSHFSFVLQHLEHKEGLGNNHYLANLSGLLCGLTFFPQWEALQAKRSWIIQQFCLEIDKQFYQDGGNFEGSTYYHALSSELAFLGLAFLIQMEENEAVAKVQTKVFGAYDVLQTLAKPNGELPQFGDNDSGRVLPISVKGEWMTPKERSLKYQNLNSGAQNQGEKELVENVLDVSRILEMGAALFQSNPTLKSYEGQWLRNFISGRSLKANWQEPRTTLTPDPSLALPEHETWELKFEAIQLDRLKSYYFQDFGMVVIKSDEFYLAMSLLQRDHAHRYRGHFHNDQLSIELWVHGQNLLSDPGVITYTGDMELRNDLRSAKAHNTPYLGEEPNRFMEGLVGLFHMMNETNTQLFALSDTTIKAALFFKNEKIEREIRIESNKVVIHDSASKPFKINTKNSLVSDGYGRILNT